MTEPIVPAPAAPPNIRELVITLFELGREITSVLNLDELLQKIQDFAFGGATGQGVVAPPCRKQAPFEVSGKRTQYPQVDARSSGG